MILVTIGTAIARLAGRGASERAAKLLGALALIILLTALLAVGKCAYDDSVIDRHEERREIEAGKARERAADRRVEDAAANTRSKEELYDAIESAPGGDLSPAARALACERLRRIGRIPPACRPQGGDGTETPAGR